MSPVSPNAARVLDPSSLTELREVGSVPRAPGVYGWWFSPGSLPVPSSSYETVDGFELLYVGIAPRRPTAGGTASTSHLRSRLTTHATNNASRSTLRLSIGVLLAHDLGLELGLHSGRLTWGPAGEAVLSEWLNAHARISWVVDDAPWLIEEELIAAVPLPLNIDGRSDAFARQLSEQRSAARRRARA